MIRLFVSDIDGCLAEPYRPYDLRRFQELAALVSTAGPVGHHPEWPAFTLCSGRPYSYVEAVTQALGLQVPVLFEAGAGLFDPVRARVSWHPAFSEDLAAALATIRHWLEERIRGTSMIYDMGKRTQAGVIGPDPDEVARLFPVVEEHVARHYPGFRVLLTSASIDVVPAHLTKEQGIAWLSEQTGVPLEAMAFIGDTEGDLGALGVVGYAFAPANATAAVKEQVGHVTRGAVIEGVLEAYAWCRRHNGRSPDGTPPGAAVSRAPQDAQG
ncbi:HAD hydrolase family protein [Rhodocaloribacter litoris]|uniref:HAD family hydrolase n=1 Tax=Rhodocaloribacter litoris TaxID=2558931 RepID=UPI0014202678|nr:HAD hydrolase family protein [Rhodocaloribacter litoris]QXD14944.1 HAD hydrolase family protein [Rhodocaloribacter litoris]GIV58956.1 MAG: phosphoglycolate phosphatase [Rhodothermaceae bacterium]